MNGPSSSRSNGHPSIPREIIEWPSYKQQADEIDPSRKELDNALATLLFEIGRVPEIFEVARGPQGLPICVADRHGRPSYRIWFTYDSQYVTLLGIIRMAR